MEQALSPTMPVPSPDASPYASAQGSPSRAPDSGHMVATTPDSQKRQRRRMVDDGTPNPLYVLDQEDSSDADDCVISPHPDAEDLTPFSDSPLETCSDQVYWPPPPLCATSQQQRRANSGSAVPR